MKFKNLTFSAAGDGLTQSYTVPQGTTSIGMKVSTGSVQQMENAGDSDYWPMSAGEPEAINDDYIAGDVISFTGTEGAVLHIRRTVRGV